MNRYSILSIAARVGIGLCVCASVSSCSVVRSLTYWYPEIDDYKIFHSVELTPSPKPFAFHE
jgi:hypothetical protein